jgi:HemY protein
VLAPQQTTQPSAAPPQPLPPPAQQPAALPAWLSTRAQGAGSTPKAPAVIPLVHPPDDPGPEAPETADQPAEQTPGWRKIFE